MKRRRKKCSPEEAARLVRDAVGEITIGMACDRFVHRATKYIAVDMVVRATRGRKQYKHDNCELYLTIGRPNYRERHFIQNCLTVGEKFPVRKVQLEWFK